MYNIIQYCYNVYLQVRINDIYNIMKSSDFVTDTIGVDVIQLVMSLAFERTFHLKYFRPKSAFVPWEMTSCLKWATCAV